MLIGFIVGFACGVGVAVWALSIVREMECEKCTWSPENYGKCDGDLFNLGQVASLSSQSRTAAN